MSVADNGATRGQLLFNSQLQGHSVTIEGTYSGHISVNGNELTESANAVTIDGGSVDSLQLPESIKAELRTEIGPGSARYSLHEITSSRLVYSDEDGRTVCERSPVPLNL